MPGGRFGRGEPLLHGSVGALSPSRGACNVVPQSWPSYTYRISRNHALAKVGLQTNL